MSDLLEAFPYQHAGAQFLASMPQALLADEMGLGKSAQVVLAADRIGAINLLVICPASVRINWDREFTRFSPLDRPCVVLLTGKDRVPTGGVVVASYDLLANKKVFAALRAIAWEALIIDEAHYAKERSAGRTRALYGHGSRSPGLVANAQRVWRLTGTPAPNNVSELWTHLKSAGIVSESYWDFVARFCTGFDSDYGFKITGHKNTDELKQLLARFMLRRKKDDVMKELPPITYQEVTVERSDVDVDLVFFEQLRGKTRQQFNGELHLADQTLRHALAAIDKKPNTNPPISPGKPEDRVRMLESLAASMVTLRRYIGMAKTPKVCEILAEELATEMIDKLVIFAVHKDVIETARQKLAKFKPVTLYGGTPAEKRQANIDKFMKDPKCRVFIGNIVAAGTGITLTSSCEVAFLEADWVPANNAQAAMRCHRIGQEKPVRVRFFSCAGSVDEEVQRALRRKTQELSKVF